MQFSQWQFFFPKRFVTRLMGCLASCRVPVLTPLLIRLFIRQYQVDMTEAAEPNPREYRTFNDFFTRALKLNARPIVVDDGRYLSPVDGVVSQCGLVKSGQLLQAKGAYYSVSSLLVSPLNDATANFEPRFFLTAYLSPRDYHRIHMPISGRLLSMTYVPGSLFAVKPSSVEGISGLFARNERVVCLFDTDHGKMAMVLVGAMIVGSMSTVWHGVVKSADRTPQHWSYLDQDQDQDQDQTIHLQQGEEMGRFLLGSTVILLMEDEVTDVVAHAGVDLQMGQVFACSSAPALRT